MSLSKENIYFIHECIDKMNAEQKVRLIIRLHENPPENVNKIQEAIACYEALDEMEEYQFLQALKKKMTSDAWETLTE